MSAHAPLWQDIAALAVAAGALVYLSRRWWPAWRSLIKGGASRATSACGTPAATSQCGSGCGRCGGTDETPKKDHRVNFTPRA